jgi:hypothetical protein
MRLIILECPYDTWERPDTRRLFDDMVGLKLDGFLKEYPYGFLPVDGIDFVGTHHLICEETPRGFEILTAYRSIALDRCRTHMLEFPLLAPLRGCGLLAHASAIEGMISRCETTGTALTYYGAWATRPDLRSGPRVQELRRVATGFHVLYSLSRPPTEIVTVASTKVKVQRIFEYWGYRPLDIDGVPLPEFRVPEFFNFPGVLYSHRSDAFSYLALKQAETCEKLWSERLEIRGAPGTRRVAA